MDRDRLAARRQLARITGIITAPATTAPAMTTTTLDPPVADETMLAVARAERAIPLLAHAIADELVDAETEMRTTVHDAWNQSMRRCLRLEARICWLVDELGRHGIEMRVVKGAASAHLDHARPERRDFGDIDILVHGSDLAGVFEVLQHAGFDRTYQTPGPAFDRQFIKSASFRNDVEIDVHRTLVDSPLGHRIDVDDLWASSTTFTLGTSTVQALPAELRLIHACLHGRLGRPPMRLSTMSDVLALAHRSDLDHALALEIAERWGMRDLISAAIAECIAETAWPDGIDAMYLDHGAPSLIDAFLAAAHRSPRSSSTVRTLLSLLSLPDTRSRLSFITALVGASLPYRRQHRRPVRTAVHRVGRALGAGEEG